LKQFEQLNKELISALGNLVFKPKNTKDILQNASMYSKHLVDKACEYYNHKLYFKLIDPSSNPGNAGQFNKAVKKQFGSTMNLLDQLTTMANVNENEGWLWVNIRNEEIQVDFSKTNSNPIIRSNNTNSSSFPLIAIDLSRHAYSDKFRNDRGAYVNAFWNNLNWSFVEKRYLRAGTFSS
jgi:Fe-Mn family superoxide dismutase